MPRSTSTEVLNSFTGGLITEATALNFPQNGCTEVDNCIFDVNGGVYRRLGLSFEPNYSLTTESRADKAVNTFLWLNPAGVANKSFLVVQVGGVLHFYDAVSTTLSNNKLTGTIDFSSFGTSTTAATLTNDCQFTYGLGRLIVVHPFCKPFYVTFDPNTLSVTATGIDIKIRDTIGVIDELGFNYDTRPSSLSDLHKYNLYNQGWKPTGTKNYINAWRSPLTRDVVIPVQSTISPLGYVIITVTDASARADYPSNADVWWLLRNASDTFDIRLADDKTRGNTPAPKGHFILDAFNQNRSTTSSINGIPTVSSGIYRPSTVAFFSGRVFYAGVNTSNFSNKVYFSQVATDVDKFSKCYQLNDPTNENLFDLLATDGGVIEIADCGQIIKLFAIQNTLLVFATNGMWVITGNQNLGFTASDFSVRKASSISTLSGSSFVDVDGLPFWWNNDGIYQLSGLNAAGMAQVDNISFNKINTFYEMVPNTVKRFAKGIYDPFRKDLIWIYRSSDGFSTLQNYELNKALSYNLATKAFTVWSFPNTTTKTIGIARVPVDGSFGVTKYLVATDSSMTFANMSSTTFTDFDVPFESFFTTGYKINGETIKKFQNNYIQIITEWIEETQFCIQGVWNAATSNDSSYYNQSRQLILFPPVPRTYNKRKVKIRGNGNILQIRITSVEGKPFNIAGWSCFVTGNQSI